MASPGSRNSQRLRAGALDTRPGLAAGKTSVPDLLEVPARQRGRRTVVKLLQADAQA